MPAMVNRMADDKSRRGRANWLAIRTYYIEGHNPTECALKFGIARETISRRASEEGWKQQRHDNITDAQNKLDEINVNDRFEALQQHANVADDLVAEIRRALNELPNAKDSKGKPLSLRAKAEILKTLGETADRSIRLGRDVRGIGKDEASNPDPDANGPLVIETVRLEPKKIAVNENGRAAQ